MKYLQLNKMKLIINIVIYIEICMGLTLYEEQVKQELLQMTLEQKINTLQSQNNLTIVQKQIKYNDFDIDTEDSEDAKNEDAIR